MANLGERYVVEELTYLRSEIRWGIYDIGTREMVRDSRRYKKSRRTWKDTEENAKHYAKLLNKQNRQEGINARTALDELSRSQIIHYQNLRKPRTAPAATGFTRCTTCGSMVKDGHSC